MAKITNVKKSTQAKKAIEPQPRLPPDRRTFGQRATDIVTTFCGSWLFITILFVYIIIWVSLNIMGLIYRWDPWPFILLNLTLSCLAAIEAPIILMSQNRQAEKDRKKIAYDYQIDRKAERGIQQIQKELVEIKKMIRKIKK